MTFDLDEVAVVIDETGKLWAKQIGFDAEKEMKAHLRACQRGGVQHLRGARVVSGEDAKRIMKKGRV